MTARAFMPTSIDEHIGQRVQLRRTMLGLSQKDLAKICGVTFQQIQKYETAGNRISASRLFELSNALQTPVSFFFYGLPGNLDEVGAGASRIMRVAEQSPDDPLGKKETLSLINLYWRLPNDEQRRMVMQVLQSLNGVSGTPTTDTDEPEDSDQVLHITEIPLD